MGALGRAFAVCGLINPNLLNICRKKNTLLSFNKCSLMDGAFAIEGLELVDGQRAYRFVTLHNEIFLPSGYDGHANVLCGHLFGLCQ